MTSLVFCLADSSYYSQNMAGPDQIFLSPDEKNPDNEKTFRIPSGKPSIDEIYSMYPHLPRRPSLVFIKTDALARNFIRDVSRLDCPSIVSVADTHHLHRPLETIIEYLRSEEFTLISAENDRHHLKWLYRHGFENLCWLPNLALTPEIRPARSANDKNMATCFIGSLGRFHPYRATVIDYLAKNVANLHIGTASQREAAAAYNKYNISLNISLNSDLNWRFFEILGAGGFLLTDRLPSESGIDTLFSEGKHYEAFGSDSELVEKMDYYTRHPEAAARIAHNGQKRYLAACQPKLLRKEMISRLFMGRENKQFSFTPTHDQPFMAEAKSHLRAYQALQEIHRISARVRLLIIGDNCDLLIQDLADYPRIITYKDVSRYLSACSRRDRSFGLNDTHAIYANSIASLKRIYGEGLNTIRIDYFIFPADSMLQGEISLGHTVYSYSENLDCHARN